MVFTREREPVEKTARRFIAEIKKLDKSPLPPDKRRAEEIIREIYILAGLPAPEKIVWCKSPLAMAAVLGLLEMDKPHMAPPGLDEDEFIRKCIRDNASAEAIWRDVLRAYAEAEAYYDNLRADNRRSSELRTIGDPEFFLRSERAGRHFRQLTGEVFATTRAALATDRQKSTCLLTLKTLTDTLKASTTGLVNTLAWEIPNGPVGYAQDLIEFFRLISGNTLLFLQEYQFELSRRVSWLAACPRLCLLVEQGDVHFNGAGLLHNAQGPALSFADGWKIYAWNGVHVPRLVVMNPEMISTNVIDYERNISVRQVMIERYQGNYYDDCGANLVATDALGKLYRKTRSGRDFVFVRVNNSTPEPDGSVKEYALRVPPEMKTPTQAIAWTFSMTPEEYLQTQKMT